MQHARPTPQQAAWQDLELGTFYPLDTSVYTDLQESQWREGVVAPDLFQPAHLDADQWMEAARAISARGDLVELRLDGPARIEHVVIQEEITEGERIRKYVIEGQVGDTWQPLCAGQSVGHNRIERIEPVAVSAIRFRVARSAAEPLIRRLAAYGAA